MVDAYITTEEIVTRLERLERENVTLRQMYSRMRMAKVDLLRLEDGDLLVVRLRRPLASSEREEVVKGFSDLFAKMGKRVELAVVGGVDEVELDVVRR